ncbi:unnamed protein product [Ilex paraguariensis]|uniref:Non-haem dioxygenase N-terminal domain-containing protein n=1 Tax=Ilex paraguariensis TaxID=185542 RepID=A0ABC8S8N3_9AQUA
MAAEVESLASSVQELSMNRSGPPSRYILKDGIGLNVASSFPVLDIPVIDLGLLASSSPEGEEQLDRLRSALGYCGYFQVESLASSVQELSMNRSGPPSRYILKDGIGLNVASSFPVLDIPVIDLGLLASSSPEGEEQLDRLRSALGYCGYFQV